MARVLVLGGGGYVGGAIVRALAASNEFTPVAGLHRSPAMSFLAAHRICDARDGAAVDRAVDGTDFAVNAVLGDHATMVASTRSLCEAASRAGLKRVVHISSMSVYGLQE